MQFLNITFEMNRYFVFELIQFIGWLLILFMMVKNSRKIPVHILFPAVIWTMCILTAQMHELYKNNWILPWKSFGRYVGHYALMILFWNFVKYFRVNYDRMQSTMKNVPVILLILTMFVLNSCGARKAKIHKTENIAKTEQKQESKANLETTSEKTGQITTKTDSDFLGFNIEPQGSTPAVFSFNYNGQKIEGSTTGKMNFTNDKKKEETRIRWKEKIHTTYVTSTRYFTHTTYKSLLKDRKTDKKSYPWWQLVIGAVLVWELVKFFAKNLWFKFLNK